MSTSNQPTGGRPENGTPPWKDAPRGPRTAAPPTQAPPQQGPPQPYPGHPAPGPQNQPQTNLAPRPGRSTMYVPPAGADDRVRESSREEAKTRAAVIDGPTRNIARNDLPTDMPDLSTVRHPGADTIVSERPPVIASPEVVPAAVAGPMRATVQLRRIDPWSTFKLALIISVALFFVWLVAVGVLYAVLDGMGVWDRLNNAFTDIVANSGDSGLVSAGQIFGYAAGIGLINVVLFTALATVGAFIYNLCTDLVGGLEVTLADRD